MSFKPDKVEEFLDIFDRSKEKIRNSKGCSLLELYRDKTNSNQFFTYSYWETEQDLENYRNSVFFNNVWSQTKKIFNDKPMAWSTDRIRN